MAWPEPSCRSQGKGHETAQHQAGACWHQCPQQQDCPGPRVTATPRFFLLSASPGLTCMKHAPWVERTSAQCPLPGVGTVSIGTGRSVIEALPDLGLVSDRASRSLAGLPATLATSSLRLPQAGTWGERRQSPLTKQRPELRVAQQRTSASKGGTPGAARGRCPHPVLRDMRDGGVEGQEDGHWQGQRGAPRSGPWMQPKPGCHLPSCREPAGCPWRWVQWGPGFIAPKGLGGEPTAVNVISRAMRGSEPRFVILSNY